MDVMSVEVSDAHLGYHRHVAYVDTFEHAMLIAKAVRAVEPGNIRIWDDGRIICTLVAGGPL